MSYSRQQLAQMVLDSHTYYDHRWAETVCRYCDSSTYGGDHKADCEVHKIQAIANSVEEEGEN